MATFSPSLERLLARDHAAISDKGRTAAYLHGQRRPRAVLLLHGLTSSPPQFERYARELHARGHNVLVPRLPRHGYADRLSTVLEKLRPDELYAAGGHYVEIARELGDRVTVAGFSLGGLLAAWIAHTYEVDRAVAIAPFFGVAWVPGFLMSSVAELALRVPNQFAWWNPFVRDRQYPQHGYPRYATHAVAHMYRMSKTIMRESLHRAPLTQRVVLVTNAREAAVNNRAIYRLYQRWRRHHPELIELLVLEGMPLSHDVVEPLRHTELAERAFPFLLNAIDPLSEKP